MKQTAFIAVLTATILFAGCSSGQTPVTSAATDTTTAVTTEAATTSTAVEETNTTAETTAEPEKPEDYADIYFMNKDGSNTAFATDFEFVDAELYKDVNGVLRYPNFQAGKDIVINFKSDIDFKQGGIYYYSKTKPKRNIIAIPTASSKENTNILKYLTCKDGDYTLKIPAKHVKPDNEYRIKLFSQYPLYDGDDNIVGYGMTFCIRCEKVTETPVPNYSTEQHLVNDNSVNATDFNTGNAKLEMFHDKYSYIFEPPKFPAGQDIVITFKCQSKLNLDEIAMYTSGSVNSHADYITKAEYLTCKDGFYTLTIPAQYAQPGYLFLADFTSKNGTLELVFGVAS